MRHQEIWVFILNLVFICHEIPIPRNIALLVNFYHGYHAWWCLQRAGTNMSQTSFHISKPFGTCSPWQPHTALTLGSCMVCVSALHWPAQFLIKVKAELKIVSLHKRAHWAHVMFYIRKHLTSLSLKKPKLLLVSSSTDSFSFAFNLQD